MFSGAHLQFQLPASSNPAASKQDARISDLLRHVQQSVLLEYRRETGRHPPVSSHTFLRSYEQTVRIELKQPLRHLEFASSGPRGVFGQVILRSHVAIAH